MSQGRHTEIIEPPTEEVAYGWTPRPAPDRSPRRQVFPRGWRDAAYFAWMLAGFAATFLLAAAGCILLAPLIGGHG